MIKIFSIAIHDEIVLYLEKVIDEPYQIHWVSSIPTLMERLQSDTYSVLILPDSPEYDIYSQCTKLKKEFSNSSILILFPTEANFNMKKAIRSGADDVLFLSSPIAKIKEDIQLAIENNEKKMYEQTQQRLTEEAKVITITSTKGGIGKTAVSVNLAASFGKKRKKIAIVDLDLQFGDVALFLDLKPKHTIYDWIKEDHSGTKIEHFMTHYKDGISILAAPQRPEFADVITEKHIQIAIDSLKKHYDIVIIDTSITIDGKIVTAFEQSDDILLLTYLDLPTLKNSKLLMDIIVSLDLKSKVELVLNRHRKVKGMTQETAEKVLGKELFAILPAVDKHMITAINEGIPFIFANPRTKFTKGILKMTESLNTLIQPIPMKQVIKRELQMKELANVGGRR